MPRLVSRLLLTLAALLLFAALLFAGAWTFRETLLLRVANHLLAPQQLQLSALSGLQLDTRRLTLDSLTLAAPPLGLAVVLEQVTLPFTRQGLLAVPAPGTLSLGTVRLRTIASGRVVDTDDALPPGRQAADLLEVLRTAPAGAVEIGALYLPESDEALALDVERSAVATTLRLEQQGASLQLTVNPADPGATTVSLTLAQDTAPVLSAEFLLAESADAIAVDGSGSADLDALGALLAILLPAAPLLPGGRFDWELRSNLSVVDSLQPELQLSLLPAAVLTVPPAMSGLPEFIELRFPERTELELGSVAGNTSLTLAPGFRVRSENLAPADALALAALELSTSAPLQVYLAPDGSFRVEGAALDLQLVGLQVPDYRVDTVLELRALQFDSADVALQTRLLTRDMRVEGLPDWLPLPVLDANIRYGNASVQLDGKLLLPDAPAAPDISLALQHQLEAGSGEVQLNLSSMTFSAEQGLATLFAAWPHPFDLLGGSLDMALTLQWQLASTEDSELAWQGTMAAGLSEGAGYFAEQFFSGLNTRFMARLDSTLPLLLDVPPLDLQVAAVDIGFPLSDLQARLRVDGAAGTVHLEQFSAALLGGSLSAEETVYDPTAERNEFTLRFSGLRLEDVVTLVAYEGVSASGAVSGEIPLTIDNSGVEVNAGRLAADAPGGLIRYQGAVSGGNAALDLVNQALSNYRFDNLQSSVDYTPDGELLLGMQLQGSNPDMNNGQRINLNLNLSNNVIDLLESLQAGRAIEDFFQERYQRGTAP